jgi:hypothetical protein
VNTVNQRRQAWKKWIGPTAMPAVAVTSVMVIVLSSNEPAQRSSGHTGSSLDPFERRTPYPQYVPLGPNRELALIAEIQEERRRQKAIDQGRARAARFEQEINKFKATTTRKSYIRVQLGMTREQVIRILGEPQEFFPPMDDRLIFPLSQPHDAGRRDFVVFILAYDDTVYDRYGFDKGEEIHSFYPTYRTGASY